ncbi:MAG: poly-gamma-glutamate hydrolase family protein [Candidatus Obscuribacterales bacterium]|nr:poly-gamma-glutamate hydrolase family protein [Candidatus Obscuribacterales bacterium]
MSTATDKYPNLEALKSELRQGTDYRIRVLDRKHPITIMSPHGGFIDIGTSAIAAAIAGRDFNLYDFQGLQVVNGIDLHVTSTRFRDDKLMKLIERSDLGVGVHNMGRMETDAIWLGGLNQSLQALAYKHLLARGFTVETSMPRYRGEHPKNICNLPKRHGIQLELPTNLVEKMFATPVLFRTGNRHPKTTDLLKQLASAVRLALKEELDAD